MTTDLIGAAQSVGVTASRSIRALDSAPIPFAADRSASPTVGNIRFALLSLATAFFSVAFSPVAPGATSDLPAGGPIALPPTVYDTGYEIAARTGTRVIHWLDNERFLFVGMKAGRGPRRDLTKIYLWDVGNGTANFYANGGWLCVADDFIHYVVQIDKSTRTQVVKEGTFGSEKTFTRPFRPGGKPWATTPIDNRFTCKSDTPSELSPPPRNEHRIVVLRPGDGYLDFGHETKLEPTRALDHLLLYRPGNDAPTKLPILLRERPSRPLYSNYIHAYLIYPTQDKNRPDTPERDWPTDSPQSIYILNRDGAVRTRTIPPGTWSNVHQPSPTRAGLLFAGGDFYRSLGLYLLRGDSVSKIDAGAAGEISVSPDGCKAAVGIQNEHLQMGSPTNLRIFNFCR